MQKKRVPLKTKRKSPSAATHSQAKQSSSQGQVPPPVAPGTLLLVHIPPQIIAAEKSVQEALTCFFRDAPPAEVERFRSVCAGGISQFDEQGRLSEGWKWCESIRLWNDFRKQEEVLFSRSQFLLDIDCAFFLRQWWVSDLIASWRHDQKWKNIERLLRGTRGKRSAQTNREILTRNQRIVATVEKYLLQNDTQNSRFYSRWYKNSLSKAHEELKSEGTLYPPIGIAALRREYERTFLKLEGQGAEERYARVYYAVTLLLQRGYAREDAEREVAIYPKRYQITEPLSVVLVHSLYNKYAAHVSPFRGRVLKLPI